MAVLHLEIVVWMWGPEAQRESVQSLKGVLNINFEDTSRVIGF